MVTDKKRFLYKLVPPLPTFVQDMTEAERKAMEEHAIYWKGLTVDLHDYYFRNQHGTKDSYAMI